jgi:hypothetical protein
MATRIAKSSFYRTTVALSSLHLKAIDKAKEELSRSLGVPKHLITESSAIQYLIVQGAKALGWDELFDSSR